MFESLILLLECYPYLSGIEKEINAEILFRNQLFVFLFFNLAFNLRLDAAPNFQFGYFNVQSVLFPNHGRMQSTVFLRIFDLVNLSNNGNNFILLLSLKYFAICLFIVAEKFSAKRREECLKGNKVCL